MKYCRLHKSLPLFVVLVAGSSVVAQPIRLHPENPHYFLFQNRPTVLVTSAEHYGAVLNPHFDYETYLEALAGDGLNYTRIFSGSYVEPPGAFGIEKNTLAPPGEDALTPWVRSETPGYAGGGNKFDLDRWNGAYFQRLADFVQAAGERGIVVEVTLFCSTYTDRQWGINPLNPVNNINGTDAIERRQAHTLENGNLLAHQESMVRKIVRELNAFDNVFYEIQNEPLADNAVPLAPINPYIPGREQGWRNRMDYPTAPSLEWQRLIASYIVDEEAALPKKHLIASNYSSFRTPLFDIDPAVSILNFHHGLPEAVLLNYGWDRVIGLDETGALGSADSTYRRQAWNFMLAGGGLFNNLDYSFTVDRPDGTDANEAPGGGGPALRRQLGILKRFIESFDFIRMRPDRDVVILAPGAFREVLADPGSAYAIYFDGRLRGRLVLDVPAGTYEVVWMNVATGEAAKRERIEHTGGRLGLDPPPYEQDIALRIVSRQE